MRIQDFAYIINAGELHFWYHVGEDIKDDLNALVLVISNWSIYGIC